MFFKEQQSKNFRLGNHDNVLRRCASWKIRHWMSICLILSFLEPFASLRGRILKAQTVKDLQEVLKQFLDS